MSMASCVRKSELNWAFGKLDKNQVANALSIFRILTLLKVFKCQKHKITQMEYQNEKILN
jgi:hypothetical protein